MVNLCREREIISQAQSLAWLDRDYGQAHKLLIKLNDHQRNCPRCKAIANGAGLAGGLFPGAVVRENVEV